MAKESNVTMADVVLQLKITNRLLTAQLKADGTMKQMDLVSLLSTTGASAKDIADILDTTPATVTVTLARLKKKKAKPEADKEKEGGG